MSYTDAIAVLAKHGYRPGTNATSERQFREARAELKAALAVTKSTPVAQVLADIAAVVEPQAPDPTTAATGPRAEE